MENLITRHRNASILVAVLFAQVLGLAVQVKRTTDPESSRLIRLWSVSAITPLEKALLWTQHSVGNLWHNYIYLRGVRAENRALREEMERMRIERVRLTEDAEQGRRLQALLQFKEQFIAETVAAQVIGSSGTEQSRAVYLDKGEKDGIKPDMAVITADGVVGKVLRVFSSSSLVLLINDQTSGLGAILEKSRLQGIVRGTATGEAVLEKVMIDERVQPGERVLTSGGDRVFPKGLTVGTVSKASQGTDAFLNIHLRPAANLNKLEEVLVITKMEEREAAPSEVAGRVRAVDILAARLPSVPDKKPEVEDKGAGKKESRDGESAVGGPAGPDVAGKPNLGMPPAPAVKEQIVAENPAAAKPKNPQPQSPTKPAAPAEAKPQ
jgi:rod shape-determining protein MreC